MTSPVLSENRVGGIILAAGASTRLGRPKQWVTLAGGKTLLQNTIDAVTAAEASPVVVVTGARCGEIATSISAPETVLLRNCPKWNFGMGESLKFGYHCLTKAPGFPDLTGVLISVCDQPFLDESVCRSLLAEHRRLPESFVLSRYEDGSQGPPAIVPAAAFAFFSSLNGDSGFRKLLRSAALEIGLIDFPEGQFDIDTPEDVRTMEDRHQSGFRSSRRPLPTSLRSDSEAPMSRPVSS